MNELDSSYNTTGLSTSNQGFNQASALQIRLDTVTIIENVELFLRGAKIQVEQNEKGEIITKRIPLGKPRANDLGIQGILNWLQLVLNPQVVQGNFSTEAGKYSPKYEDYIFYLRIDLAQAILINCYEWEIAEQDMDLIVDSIMSAVEPYMTRLIDNKERESYANTITHNETNRVNEGKGFSLFGTNKS